MGLDPHRMIAGRAAESPQHFELWPEHAHAWAVYLGAYSQWRVVPGWQQAMWLGLDYGGVEIVMRRYGVPEDERDEVFAQVQVLEDEELRLRNRTASSQ